MKSSPPLISIIIPTHNRSAILKRALQSALAQTYANMEIIVVDDASTDDTRAVVLAQGDSRLHYLSHTQNRGGAVARNTGIAAARGEYVTFLDSDDEWLPEKLVVQESAMRECRALFSYCQSIRADATGPHLYPQRPYVTGSLLRYLAFDPLGGMSTPSFMVHRSVLVRFDETLTVYQDWDFVLQLRQRTDRFLFVPQPLCRIHYDAPNRTRQYRGVPLIERTEPFLRKHATEVNAAPDVRRFLIWGCVLNALEHHDRKLARAILWNHRIWPSLWRQPRACSAWLRCLLPAE